MSVYDNLVGMEEVLDEFIIESTELLEEVNEDLVHLESEPDSELVNRIFRAFHTMKGTCGFLGFVQSKDLAHVAEDLLNKLRNNEIEPSSAIIDVLLKTVDWFSSFIDDVKERVEKEYEIDPLLQQLEAVRNGAAEPAPPAEAPAEAVEESATNGKQEAEVEAPATEAEAVTVGDNGHLAPAEAKPTSVYDNLVGMEEVLDEFIIESTELLEEVNEDLVHLESEPDSELVNRIFRAFHTMKGTCGFLGFVQSKDLAHVAEDLLNKLRNNEIEPSSAIIDVLLKTVDWFSSFIDDVKERVEKEYEIDPLLQQLEAVRNGAAEPAPPAEAPAEAVEESATNGEQEAEVEAPATEAEAVTIGDNGHPAPAEVEPVTDGEPAEDGELALEEEKAPEPEVVAEPAAEKPAKAPPKDGKPPKPVETIRVDMERLENLMNLAGELVLSRNQLGQAYTNLKTVRTGDAALDNLDQVSNSLGRITTEIQEAVMQIRMLPISNVFRKYPRVVRDLSHERGKSVELVMVGEDTELDRSVIEAISDPLLHLVRNSVDHGIETPELRKAAGKPEQGTVILRASHEGNHIIIEVEDDGGGMDAEKLVEKALEKAVITPAEAESMSYREKLNLIFRPGFSTAEKVTDVSGRGVGMDVVHTNVSKLNGAIDIDTKIGAGTRVAIKLPLTLAIVTGLKVNIWDENYIIPFVNIVETVKLTESDLTRIEDKWVIRFRDSVVHTLFLDEWFRVPGREEGGEQDQYAVVVSVAEFRYALVVTGLRGQEEAVIKPLGQALGRIPGIAGGTIGGDGLITLILDVPELIYQMGAG